MFNAVRFNNIYMAPPMGLNPFMGGCGCNSFNPMFQFGMMNSLFSMPQMFSFPSFSMPIFSPFSMMSGYSMPSMGENIFSMANYSMPMFNPMMNFGLPSLFGQMNLLNQYGNMFGTLLGTKLGEASNADNVKVVDVDNSPVKDTGKLDKHFLKRVKQVAKKLNCNYKDLLALINSESGFDPKAKCGSYVGLIQFGDAAVEELRTKCGCKGLTKEQISNMSRLEQLDLAEKLLMYIKKWKFSPDARLSAGDLYAMILAPGRANREVLYSKGESGYNPVNAKMDYNKDGKITKSEMSRRIREKNVNESIFA